MLINHTDLCFLLIWRYAVFVLTTLILQETKYGIILFCWIFVSQKLFCIINVRIFVHRNCVYISCSNLEIYCIVGWNRTIYLLTELLSMHNHVQHPIACNFPCLRPNFKLFASNFQLRPIYWKLHAKSRN